MADAKVLEKELLDGTCDEALAKLYAPDGDGAKLQKARERAAHVAQMFAEKFPENHNPAGLYSGPGRTEIGGNHTDHQHGHVLCGSVDLDILACAAPNNENKIRVISEGHTGSEISLDDLSVRAEEYNTSNALVRGMAAGVSKKGLPVGGFDAYLVSDVLTGSGLSSSAAYEVLLGNILNHLYSGDKLTAEDIAKIGQYAENEYFGKPSGLMDQMGSSIGGAVAIDFADPAAPVVKKADYDFARSGHALCIIDSGSAHDDLTYAYAEIPQEMGAVAGFFNKKFLRDVSEKDFYDSIADLRASCGDRAVLRAAHFFDDDRTAQEEAEALAEGDFDKFLALINKSGISSGLHLQNECTTADPKQQAIPVAIAIAKKLLNGAGAVRVHGGGFAGTIQAFVPEEQLESFREGIEKVFGEGSCHILHIRPQGGCVIL